MSIDKVSSDALLAFAMRIVDIDRGVVYRSYDDESTPGSEYRELVLAEFCALSEKGRQAGGALAFAIR